MEYSNNMDNLNKEIEEYNPETGRKMFLLFDDLMLLICLPIKKLIQY